MFQGHLVEGEFVQRQLSCLGIVVQKELNKWKLVTHSSAKKHEIKIFYYTKEKRS